MAQSFRGTPLGWGIVFLAICSIWLVLMLSNRSIALPLFFLGGQTLALPVGFWLFGGFVLGNGVSLGILSFLQFTIVRLARNGKSNTSPRNTFPRNAAPESEWEEDEFDWEEPPQKSVSSPSPAAQTPPAPQADRASAGEQAEQPENEDFDLEDSTGSSQQGHPDKAAAAPPHQGQTQGSSYSYQYRSARRTQDSATSAQSSQPPRPSLRPSSNRNAQAGLPQKVVDVNYRIINPGSGAPNPAPRNAADKKRSDRRWDERQGWDDDPEDW